jgi:hypothetical protein
MAFTSQDNPTFEFMKIPKLFKHYEFLSFPSSRNKEKPRNNFNKCNLKIFPHISDSFPTWQILSFRI